MKRKLIYAAFLTALLGGCTQAFPFKMAPTESQKRAADLAVKDLAILQGHVQPAVEPIREEGQAAAEIAQTYFGLPKERAISQAANNPFMLADAQAAATKPDPTLQEVVIGGIAEAEAGAAVGFNLLDAALTAAVSIAGAWGLGRHVSGIKKLKAGAEEAKAQVTLTADALREVVTGVQALDADTKAKVKAAQSSSQSPATAKLVAEAKAG